MDNKRRGKGKRNKKRGGNILTELIIILNQVKDLKRDFYKDNKVYLEK